VSGEGGNHLFTNPKKKGFKEGRVYMVLSLPCVHEQGGHTFH
jgi:hypothetical protein